MSLQFQQQTLISCMSTDTRHSFKSNHVMTHCDPSPSPFEFYFGTKLILSQGEAQRSGAEIFSKRPKTRTSSVSLPTVY